LHDAQNNLAMLYDQGWGVQKDPAQAFKWLSSAAGQGDASAQYNLGEAYVSGRGVKQDYVQALLWFRRAADQGSAPRMPRWAIFMRTVRAYPAATQKQQGCIEKRLTTVSVKRRRFWALCTLRVRVCHTILVKRRNGSPEQLTGGDAVGQSGLGRLYYSGQGVRCDRQKAAEWFRKAAEQGYAAAESNLGYLFESGEGVPVNYPEAYKWYQLAAARGYAPANIAMMSLAKIMTPKQLLDSKSRLSTWRGPNTILEFSTARMEAIETIH
jgi:uncharacterized protein